MREYNEALDALCFTEEEQAMLTKKLEQAAQSAQRPRKRRHPRRVVCIAAAAACALTVTAAAANSLAPILQEYFADSTPAAKQTLAESVLPLDLEQSHAGYTVRLTECIGDDTRIFFGGTLTLPEDTSHPYALSQMFGKLYFGDSEQLYGSSKLQGQWDQYDKETRTIPFTIEYPVYIDINSSNVRLDISGLDELFTFHFLLDYDLPAVTLYPDVETIFPHQKETAALAHLTEIRITPISISLYFAGDVEASDFPCGTPGSSVSLYTVDSTSIPVVSTSAESSGNGVSVEEHIYLDSLLDLSQISYIEVNGIRIDIP